MQDDHELHIAQKTSKAGGGGGYRFNFYGGGQGKEEEEEKKKKKKPTSPVEVHLSSEAEETLSHPDDDGEDKSDAAENSEAKPDGNKTAELEKRDYSAILKNRKKLGH